MRGLIWCIMLMPLALNAKKKPMSERWEASVEAAFARQAIIDPVDTPRGRWSWVPIKPITDRSIDGLRKRFPEIRSLADIRHAEAWSSPAPVYLKAEREHFARYLGPPLKPDGVLIHGAPPRGHWWISKLDDKLQGIVLIVEAETGHVFAAYAPPNGFVSVWPARVGQDAFTAASRVSYRLWQAAQAKPKPKP